MSQPGQQPVGIQLTIFTTASLLISLYNPSFTFMALQGSAWVQIEPSAAKVDRRLEVLRVAEAAGHALDLLNLAVEPLAHRVGHRMLIVGQDVVDVPADGLRRLANRFQPTVRRPEVPPFPELPA